jgi:CheY-like chemotaxis protein
MIKDVSYVPTRTTRKVVNEGPDWGTGEIIYLYFRMQDTGKGLSDEEKKLLFLRFSQANPKTHVQYGGSGLGLFISRELVELQGGEIGVSSESGKGSTFEFYVKARKSNGPRDQNDFADGYVITPSRMRQTQVEDSLDVSSLEATASTAPNSSSSSQQSSRMLLKVLVVEDNVVNQKVLGKQLRNLGCAVHIANHGGECIDQLRESRWWHGRQSDGLDLGVILMDLEMPVMDGLTCATKIRELQSEGKIVGHVPIIAVTANARDEQIMTALAAGMVCRVVARRSSFAHFGKRC